MTETIEAKVTHHFNETEERVFDAWLDPATVRAWMGLAADGRLPGTIETVEIDAHEGGAFHFSELRQEGRAEARGTYKAMERPHKLSFTWIAGPEEAADPSLVTIVILPHPDGGSVLTLTHEMDAEWADTLERTENGWNAMLSQIGALLDAGQV